MKTTRHISELDAAWYTVPMGPGAYEVLGVLRDGILANRDDNGVVEFVRNYGRGWATEYTRIWRRILHDGRMDATEHTSEKPFVNWQYQQP